MQNDHMDAQTAVRLIEAQTVRGQPPTDLMGYEGTLGQLLDERAYELGGRPYLIYYDDDGARHEYSYTLFRSAVHRVARFLTEQLGLRVGQRIATVAHNHADCAVIYFAAWMAGVTIVPVNVGEDDDRLLFIINNAECRFALVQPDYLPRLAALRGDLPELESVVQFGGTAQAAGANLWLDGALPDDGILFDPPPFDSTQEALIVYTSGTTGAPKGVVLSQYNLLVDSDGIRQWHMLDGERMMCVLPIHHVNGTVVTLITPLVAAGSTVLNRGFSPRVFWQRIADEGVQVVSVVPTLLAFLLEWEGRTGDFERYDLSRFRHIICGAGPLTVQLAQDFEERFGVPIIHGYGLSETTCYSCFLPLDLDGSGHAYWMRDYGYPSIGVPIYPNEMAIHDSEGQPLPAGAAHKGEIVIRGHNVMQGYFRRPDANADSFTYGWFRSGDEGFWIQGMHGRPFYFITGRLKEIIIRGGVNYSTYEIDEVLMGLPGVRAGLAVGFPNRYYGEEVGAYIVLEDGVEMGEEELLALARHKLPFSKSPKVVIFGSEIPVTSTGKYQRLKLAPLFAEFKDRQFNK